MNKMKAAYDEGMAAGHFQADSMYARLAENQNRMHDKNYSHSRDKHKCPSDMKGEHRNMQKGA